MSDGLAHCPRTDGDDFDVYGEKNAPKRRNSRHPCAGVSIAAFVHPGVTLACFIGELGITMFLMHPVVTALSLAGALACSALTRGGAATLRGLGWQLPLMVLICLVNPLFSASGSTLVARIGPMAVYAESLAYGACAGAMMVATVVWLECAAAAVGQEGLMLVGGSVFPVVTLMVSLTAQLVPQTLRRSRDVRAVEAACTASGSAGEGALAEGARLSTTLLAWGLEDSLVRSDSMRARGWASGRERTSYRARRFGSRDGFALAAVFVALAAAFFLAWVAWHQWTWYPVMPRLVAWWGYAPLTCFLALPAVVSATERLRWR